ncbi:MAG: LAS superfamily LD-carboxypeptidase LdcB [Saprospiraceae bacterium]|jgi:LAS superfamily LD-carboxypeptidase LdcB|tara:strand:- start:201 stop:875 length:675 start_codon:yes stop_codon:yes gene_type:complete
MQITTNILSGKTQTHLNDSCLLHAGVLGPFSVLQSAAKNEGFDLQVASGFRSYERQLLIWNEKATGKRPLLDSFSRPLNIENLTDTQKVFSILRWSALPGCSRHHWGTDIDVWDAAAVPKDYRPRLVASEYGYGGQFYKLASWLSVRSEDFGFEMPYAQDHGGIAREPWHLSYAPLAKKFEDMIDISFVRSIIDADALALSDAVINSLDEIFPKFILKQKKRNS